MIEVGFKGYIILCSKPHRNTDVKRYRKIQKYKSIDEQKNRHKDVQNGRMQVEIYKMIYSNMYRVCDNISKIHIFANPGKTRGGFTYTVVID